MSLLQSNSTLENNPIDDIISAYKDLIRSALHENPVLTQEQFIYQTFEVAGIDILIM